MALYRWASDCAIYVIGNDTGWECVSCCLPGNPDIYGLSDDALREHIKRHRSNGDLVPIETAYKSEFCEDKSEYIK